MGNPAPTPPLIATKKRKQPASQPSQSSDAPHRKKRRVKVQDARVIAAQTTGNAFGAGEINVDKFVKAREFEIGALEGGMKRAKKTLSARAFQNVPTDLRRRTASHDVKRIPKRLRARAAREMVEDNTPTGKARKKKLSSRDWVRVETFKKLQALGKRKTKTKDDDIIKARLPRVKKNKLAKPPKPKAKFRKRQRHKAWLPTHLFHTKRAHMTPPKEPLWRMSIPLTPITKSYRPTHRASKVRGAVAWDMSYTSTIGLQGPERSIVGLLKAIGVGRDESGDLWDTGNSRWMAGKRFWQGWVHERNGWPTKAIAPVVIVWCADDREKGSKDAQGDVSVKKKKEGTRKAFIRVHPAAFLELWEEILRISKIQKPCVTVEDLRFEIGSIELTGPASTEAIVNVLRPSQTKEFGADADTSLANVWSKLATLENPASLPYKSVIGMEISDPRLHHHARPRQQEQDLTTEQELLQVLAMWPMDEMRPSSRLFDRSARMEACRQLPSQRAISRRRVLAGPGKLPQPQSQDPQIPVLVLASRNTQKGQGSWHIILPWKCVLPVWYSLMYYPLKGGGAMRFGGLSEKRQIAFETDTPWFPGDFPGTKSGQAWELKEREKRRRDWARKPKGKRIEWDSVNLGHAGKGEVGVGWACDWQRLVHNDSAQDERDEAEIQTYHTPMPVALSVLKSGETETYNGDSGIKLATVVFRMLGRGVPTACARVYRLPTDSTDLRQRWVDLISYSSTSSASSNKQKHRQAPPKDAPKHVRQQHLAASLLEATDPARDGRDKHVQVPSERDLIGFVTTGNFDLSQGRGSGIGGILLAKALEGVRDPGSSDHRRHRHFCIVREAGQGHGRLARWELA